MTPALANLESCVLGGSREGPGWPGSRATLLGRSSLLSAAPGLQLASVPCSPRCMRVLCPKLWPSQLPAPWFPGCRDLGLLCHPHRIQGKGDLSTREEARVLSARNWLPAAGPFQTLWELERHVERKEVLGDCKGSWDPRGAGQGRPVLESTGGSGGWGLELRVGAREAREVASKTVYGSRAWAPAASMGDLD